MLKKKYIKRAYIEECICDKCGVEMEPCNWVLTTYPAKYSYICPTCKEKILTTERFGTIKYEFEDDENE